MGVYSSDWPWRRLFAAMGGFPVLLSCFRERERKRMCSNPGDTDNSSSHVAYAKYSKAETGRE